MDSELIEMFKAMLEQLQDYSGCAAVATRLQWKICKELKSNE